MIKILSIILLSGATAFAVPPKKVLEEAKNTQTSADKKARASQKTVNALADKTDSDLREYRATLKQIENMKAYNQQMRDLIASQLKEMEDMKEKMKNVTNLKKEILPLVGKMSDSIETFVSLDVPFLKTERSKRITDLKALMSRADISVSEKFRRVLEAYQVEAEYGRTIEAYNGNIETDKGELAGEFLRVGRLALMFKGLDGNTFKRWDADKGAFVSLEGKYKSALKDGLRVAKKQKAPNLLRIPVYKTASVSKASSEVN